MSDTCPRPTGDGNLWGSKPTSNRGTTRANSSSGCVQSRRITSLRATSDTVHGVQGQAMASHGSPVASARLCEEEHDCNNRSHAGRDHRDTASTASFLLRVSAGYRTPVTSTARYRSRSSTRRRTPAPPEQRDQRCPNPTQHRQPADHALRRRRTLILSGIRDRYRRSRGTCCAAARAERCGTTDKISCAAPGGDRDHDLRLLCTRRATTPSASAYEEEHLLVQHFELLLRRRRLASASASAESFRSRTIARPTDARSPLNRLPLLHNDCGCSGSHIPRSVAALLHSQAMPRDRRSERSAAMVGLGVSG